MYSERFWQHIESPSFRQKPRQFAARARRINPICPDILEFFLEDGLLFFEAQACAPVIGLASLLCCASRSQPWRELALLSPLQLCQWCGSLPPQKGHAIALVHSALEELCKTVAPEV